MKQEPSKFSLGRPASAAYQAKLGRRTSVLDRAREYSLLTLPHVFPPEGWEPGDELELPQVGVGADCVGTLASKLMYLALPPSRIGMNYAIKEYRVRKTAEAQQMDPEEVGQYISKIYSATGALEEEHRKRLEATRARDAYSDLSTQLIIGGNALRDWRHIDLPVIHRMDSYVVHRDKLGRQVWVILEESCLFEDLPEAIQPNVTAQRVNAGKMKDGETPEWEDEVTIHTVCYRDPESDPEKPVWLLWQEWNGAYLKDSGKTFAAGKEPPLSAEWLVAQPGHDWGLSYVQLYIADLYLVEEGHEGLRDGLQGAVEYNRLIKPSAPLKIQDLKKARNGDWLSGNAEDFGVTPSLNKFADLNFAITYVGDATRRLERAFLKKMSIQRSGERVTAEEWQQLANEIDEAMGGLYSKLSQTVQRGFLKRFIELHFEEDNFLPNLMEKFSDEITLAVASGADALGRTHEGDQLLKAATEYGTAMAQPSVASDIDRLEFARRLFASRGVRTEGLIKSAEQVTQEMDKAQQDSLAQQTLPAVAKEGASALFQGMKDQALSQPTEGQIAQ
ncbi:portal protein [Aestuariivirga sp.]|uniref:portal protein n=1 Tax=Aestuariivirga sp. TaxID=2650926 RepID=UPI0039E44B18